MKFRELGASGIEASVVSLGTWVMGGGAVWGQDTDDAESIRVVQAALDMGINLIDTAPAYGFGRAETLIGQAIRDRRDKTVLATKCGLIYDDQRGSYFCPYDGREFYRCLTPESIRLEIEQSLRRLQTDVIDLYQVHWPAIPPVNTPIEETMACLMTLKEEGKIRAIGVSNVTLDELKAYAAAGDLHTNQPHYSMLTREIEAEVLPWCLENKVSTLAYSPLEQGLLTGKIGRDRKFGETECRSNKWMYPWMQPGNRERVIDMLDGWADLPEKYACSLAQLTIAWTVAQPGVTHALCGARRIDQLEDNAGAADLVLEAADLERMRRDIEALGTPLETE